VLDVPLEEEACWECGKRTIGWGLVAMEEALTRCERITCALFVWLITHQPAVLFSQNKPATSNQTAVLFSQNKSAPATSQTNRLNIFFIVTNQHQQTHMTIASP
jgi:hypothetical protein